MIEEDTQAAEIVAVVDDTYKETDIFLWANNLVQYIEDIKVDLFFFNKNSTVFSVKLGGEASRQLRGIFIDEVLEYVLDGIEKGLTVRSFEEAESEELVLQCTKVKNVDGLVEVLGRIRSQQMETFVEQDHDLKRMKGVIARCHHPDMKSFYIVKGLSASNIMKGESAWLLKDGIFKPFESLAALKLPIDNQLLVVEQDLFVFKQPKLKQLFGYDAKATSIAVKKVKEIQAHFKLSFAEGADMQLLIKGKPAIIKKLQKIKPEVIKQQDLLDHAEEIGVEMLTDEAGSILIMDDRDVTNFVNLLNEDYITSPITGEPFEILKKRPLKPQNNDEDGA